MRSSIGVMHDLQSSILGNPGFNHEFRVQETTIKPKEKSPLTWLIMLELWRLDCKLYPPVRDSTPKIKKCWLISTIKQYKGV